MKTVGYNGIRVKIRCRVMEEVSCMNAFFYKTYDNPYIVWNQLRNESREVDSRVERVFIEYVNKL